MRMSGWGLGQPGQPEEAPKAMTDSDYSKTPSNAKVLFSAGWKQGGTATATPMWLPLEKGKPLYDRAKSL